jgi:putative ABC transport system ATP-binding protein
MAASTPAIEVDEVSRTYAEGTEAETVALTDVTFKIEPGEYVAIIGPSGSGKSTLLNLVGGLDRPSHGRVLIDGADISKLPNTELARIRNRKIGFVFQSFNLISRLSAVENVELPLLVTSVPNSEIRSRALALLDEFGIRNKADRKPSQMSGGEQQRVAVARALATDPLVLLGDEPTGNLDTKATKVMVDLFNKLNRERKKTIIVITHNLDIASQFRKVISLRDGRVIEINEN